MRHPCFYGIDMPTQDELVAAGMDDVALEAALKERFACDSVTYLSIAGLSSLGEDRMCAACFDGRYIVPVSQAERQAIESDRRG